MQDMWDTVSNLTRNHGKVPKDMKYVSVKDREYYVVDFEDNLTFFMPMHDGIDDE